MSTKAKSNNAKSVPTGNRKTVSSDPNSPQSSDSRLPEPEIHRYYEHHGFHFFAARAAALLGSSPAFLAATVIVILWGATGPYFHFSDTWQLVINTGTTVVTFLMVFLIQNTQNRDARALHLKLDEVIRALHSAHNEMIDIERLSDQELEHLAGHYEHIRQASEARKSARRGEKESGQEKRARQKRGGAVREKAGEERKAS
ncbi:MAG TPA: low affinity iron permease family protein [Nitrospirales bacterium]